MEYMEQEESYTSQASFLDGDYIPVYTIDNLGTAHTFSGKRITRGSYMTKDGIIVNADVNAAANILAKSIRVAMSLPGRGCLEHPWRIRVA